MYAAVLQMLYGAVTLAGYAAHFSPELLTVLRPAAPNEGGGSAGSPAAAELGGKLASAADAEAEAEAVPVTSTLLDSPSKHGMRLQNREAARSSSGDVDSGSHEGAGASAVQEAPLRMRKLRGSPPLLDPHVLWLCGSFTLQVLRHLKASCPSPRGCCGSSFVSQLPGGRVPLWRIPHLTCKCDETVAVAGHFCRGRDTPSDPQLPRTPRGTTAHQ